MEFKTVRRESICDQVFEQIKQKIIEGEWQQGKSLPSENELAVTFGVSRVTVRQAIQKLGSLGITETLVGKGTFVKTLETGTYMQNLIPMAYLTPRNTLEVLDFRYVIEVETAALAAQRCKEQDVEELEKQLEEMQQAKGDSWAFAQADLEFHMLVANITGNSLIVETYSILQDILAACMKDTVENLGVEIGIPYHVQLIEVFAANDSEGAKEIMRKHMISTRKQFEQVLQAGTDKTTT